MTWTYTNPAVPDFTASVRCEVRSDRAVDVTLTWPGVKQQPDLPALGLSFQLNPRLSHVRYYGLGPDDCYADRCTGALLGWHEYDVQDGMTRYAKPQESGNRMGVRPSGDHRQRRPRCRRFRARAGDQRSALSARGACLRVPCRRAAAAQPHGAGRGAVPQGHWR